MVNGLRCYLLLAGMWVRATMAYRTSFVSMTLAQFAITSLEFAAILIMFSHVPALGGFTLAEIAFLYGLSGACLGLADLLMGNTERLGERIRRGSLDTMLIRPMPTLVQIAADEFALRRIGRIAQSGCVLGWAIAALEVTWTWDRLVLLPITITSGAAIFCAVLVLGAAFQFVAQDAAEVTNAFTYGGDRLTQYPLTIYPPELIRAVTFLVPLGFINWYPALHMLDRTDPLGLPAAVRFASPLVAALLCAVAGLAWRAGIRRYRSTGS